MSIRRLSCSNVILQQVTSCFIHVFQYLSRSVARSWISMSLTAFTHELSSFSSYAMLFSICPRFHLLSAVVSDFQSLTRAACGVSKRSSFCSCPHCYLFLSKFFKWGRRGGGVAAPQPLLFCRHCSPIAVIIYHASTSSS